MLGSVLLAHFAVLLTRASPRSHASMAATPSSTFRNPNNLPCKTCVVCNRPFTWRKKWESSWDEITTCSKRCNGERKKSNRIARGAERAALTTDSPVTISLPDGISDDECSSPVEAGPGSPPRASITEVMEPFNSNKLTMADKVSMIVTELDVDGSLPIMNAVEAANAALGLDGSGTLAQQVDTLMGALGIGLAAGDTELQNVDPKAARKAAAKAAKAQRRARREGTDTGGQKSCDLCGSSVDLLIRCQVDSGKEWKMTCGRCWKTPAVAGGVVDGNGQNSHYRYGGLWKNLHKVDKSLK